MGLDIQTVDVLLSERSYTIYVGDRLNDSIVDFISENYAGKAVFVITDDTVRPLFADKIFDLLNDNFDKTSLYSVKSGEESKSIAVYGEVLEWLARSGARRDSLIVAIGGGVVGDLSGFVASSYMRGIDFIQIPTTLLAQVDSSVGGKTAVNIPAGKNLVGAFYQPKAVFCDSNLLKMLPERELKAGYAEIYKYGLLWDHHFMGWLHDNGASVLRHNKEALQYAVKRCCEIKAEIVAKDEKESSVRALLNLGHTFGHALEALCEYDERLRHGEAVAIGMVLAARLSYVLGHITEDDVEMVFNHIKAMGMPTGLKDIVGAPEVTVEKMLDLMGHDKKASASGLTFIILESIGNAVIDKNVDESKLREVLEDFVAAA